MIDQPKPKQETPVEVEAAARTFTLTRPVFEKKIQDLSLKSAKRVLKAVVEFPLNDDKDTMLVHRDELELFQLAMELMEAKVKMIEYSVQQRQQQEDTKATQPVVEIEKPVTEPTATTEELKVE